MTYEGLRIAKNIHTVLTLKTETMSHLFISA